MVTRKSSKSGRETKSRILDAALKTVRLEGMVGASARSIARTGDFNQALIFYHFGSVEELLYAAVERAHENRMETFGAQIKTVTDIGELVSIGRAMRSSGEDPDHQALSAIVAAWPAESEMGPRIAETLAQWDDLIAGALERILAGTSIGTVLPYRQIAHSVSALFLGLELFGRLDPGSTVADETFSALQVLAVLAEPLLGDPKA